MNDSVALTTFTLKNKITVTLWKYTPEDRFRTGEQSLYWFYFSGINQRINTTKEVAFAVCEKYGWRRNRIYAPPVRPSFNSRVFKIKPEEGIVEVIDNLLAYTNAFSHFEMSAREGLVEIEPNVFKEAS